MKALNSLSLFLTLALVVYIECNDILTPIRLQTATDCDSNSYYDISKLICTPCPTNSVKLDCKYQIFFTFLNIRKIIFLFNLLVYNCFCNESYRYTSNTGGGGIVSCQACPSGTKQSPNGLDCLICNAACDSCDDTTSILQESSGQYICTPCPANTRPVGNQCVPCYKSTFFNNNFNVSTFNCQCNFTQAGICFLGYSKSTSDAYNNQYLSNDVTSWYLREYAFPAYEQCRLEEIRNASACQNLANMCVLSIYSTSERSICESFRSIAGNTYWPDNMPSLPAPYSQNFGSYQSLYSISSELQVKLDFSTNNCTNAMQFYAARYSLNGSLLSFGLLDLSELQLCSDYSAYSIKNTFISYNYKKSCSISIKNLYSLAQPEPIFYDLYFRYRLTNGTYTLVSVPVIIKDFVNTATQLSSQDDSSTLANLFRRFFLVDTISGQKTQGGKIDYIMYAQSIRLRFDLMKDNTDGRIYPPILVIDYARAIPSVSASDDTALVNAEFEVYYRMNLDSQVLGIWIAFAVLAIFGIIIGFVKTWIWNKRSGRLTVDLITIFKFFMFINEMFAYVFFVILIGVTIWWLIFFKGQSVSYSFLPQSDQLVSYQVLIILPFVLKIFDALHLVFTQVSYNVFLIDWEKPRGEKKGDVSCWRTLFVANEWNEIQTFRKTNTSIQLVLVLFFLKVINLEALTTSDCVSNVTRNSADEYIPAYNSILRVGMASSMYLLIGIFQWFIYVFIYARCVSDKLGQFVDFCSVSNISVLIMTHAQYGYYIHGKSPSGNSDTNMRQMAKALEKEKNDLVARRGLLPDSDHQLFSVSLPSRLMKQYTKVMHAVNERLSVKAEDAKETQLDKSLLAYKKLNDFFMSFVDHVSFITINFSTIFHR